MNLEVGKLNIEEKYISMPVSLLRKRNLSNFLYISLLEKYKTSEYEYVIGDEIISRKKVLTKYFKLKQVNKFSLNDALLYSIFYGKIITSDRAKDIIDTLGLQYSFGRN